MTQSGKSGQLLTSDVIGDHRVSFIMYLALRFNHSCFSLTRKCIAVLYIFVPIITLSVQHGRGVHINLIIDAKASIIKLITSI